MVELDWNHDNRSIGILEESDVESSYKPLIMFNFKFLGYISSESNPYRGYQVLIFESIVFIYPHSLVVFEPMALPCTTFNLPLSCTSSKVAP